MLSFSAHGGLQSPPGARAPLPTGRSRRSSGTITSPPAPRSPPRAVRLSPPPSLLVVMVLQEWPGAGRLRRRARIPLGQQAERRKRPRHEVIRSKRPRLRDTGREMPEESTTSDLAELFRRGLEALDRRDFDAIMSSYAPGAVSMYRLWGSAASRAGRQSAATLKIGEPHTRSTRPIWRSAGTWGAESFSL